MMVLERVYRPSLRKAYHFPPDGGELVHNIGAEEVDGTNICPHCGERIYRVRVQVRVTR